MPMSREVRSTVELAVVMASLFVILWGTMFLTSWIIQPDRGECLVQHRGTVMELYYNGFIYEDRPTSRMVCDVWEYPEGRP